MKYSLCPRCKGRWQKTIGQIQGEDHYIYYTCNSFCGMSRQSNIKNKFGYSIVLDKYTVIWWYSSGIHCGIYYDKVWQCELLEPLPFDVSVGMIKLALTFS
jgi:hypothetical protein